MLKRIPVRRELASLATFFMKTLRSSNPYGGESILDLNNKNNQMDQDQDV